MASEIFDEIEWRDRTTDAEDDTLAWVTKINCASEYNADSVAQSFFAKKKESEIALTMRKLTELQGDIEKVLRDKVTHNYITFIKAKDDIRRTGSELSELSQLVETTRDLIKEVKSNSLREDRSMRKNSMMDVVKGLVSSSDKAHTSSSASEVQIDESSIVGEDEERFPGWLRRSPDTIRKYITEKKFSVAVTEVLSVRKYCEGRDASHGTLDNLNLGLVEKTRAIVDELGLEMAHTLMHSIIELPNSHIWGAAEQRRRLKMLISLGYYDLAAEAFSHASDDIISAVLTDVEASGDTLTYILDLSKAFFASFQTVTENFLMLFADYIGSPGVMSILVSWAQSQVSQFAANISSQIFMGTKEVSALTIIHLKPKSVRDLNLTSTADSATSIASSETAQTTGADNAEMSSHVDMLELERRRREDINLAFSMGPLTFARRCLGAALGQSQQHASAALQGLDDLGWFMFPELKRSVTQYAEDLMTETVSQVKHDTWSGVHASFWELQVDPHYMEVTGCPPSLHRDDGNDKGKGGTTGSSFMWITVAISHFVREVMVLLRAEQEVFVASGFQEEDEEETAELLSGGHGEVGVYESVEDEEDEEEEFNLCELEPVVVVSVLRLVVVYSLELERGVTHSRKRALSQAQVGVLRRTLAAFADYTIPSVSVVLNSAFLDTRFRVLEGMDRSPADALQEVRLRLLALLADL